MSLARLNSGFYCKQVLDLLESKSIDYITAVRFYLPIQKMISLRQTWMVLDEGIELCDHLSGGPLGAAQPDGCGSPAP